MRWLIGVASLVAHIVWAQTISGPDPGSGPSPVGQMVADAIRTAARADIAFIAAGFITPGPLEGQPSAEKLSKKLTYPGEEIYVLALTGEKILKAMERSLSLLPQPNRAFLQVSGIKVEYSSKAPANNRVNRILVGNALLDPSKLYKVAMPATLARGALGYFTIWQKEQISEETGITLEKAIQSFLEGKTSWPLGEQERVVGD